MEPELESNDTFNISLIDAYFAVVPSVSLLIISTLYGFSLQVPFLLGILWAGVIGVIRTSCSWHDIEHAATKGMYQSSYAVLILVLIGATIAVWMSAGVIPSLIYYGVNWITPRFYLVEAFLLTFLMALATGSDTAAFGTIGVAVLTVGYMLGVPLEVSGGLLLQGL